MAEAQTNTTNQAPGNFTSKEGDHVFVYGSLMNDSVLSTLLKRKPLKIKAIIHSPKYKRMKVTDQVFPGIVPVINKIDTESNNDNNSCADTVYKDIDGFLLTDLSLRELRVFDEFEDEHYMKRLVDIKELENDKGCLSKCSVKSIYYILLNLSSHIDT